MQFAVQQAEAEIAQEAWDQVGEGIPQELTTKKPQLKQAKAALEVAKAQVQSAEKKLNKTFTYYIKFIISNKCRTVTTN